MVITEEVVKSAAPGPSNYVIRDDKLVGFGLCITPRGAKSFVVEARVNGKSQRLTVGRADVVSVAAARKAAMAMLAKMHGGADLKAEAKAKREKSITLSQALDLYISSKDKLRSSTASKYRAQLNRVMPDWLDRPISAITKEMVAARYRERLKVSVADTNGAFRVLKAVLRRAFKHQAEGGPLKAIATDILTGDWTTLPRKTRLLEPKELPAWVEAVTGLRSRHSSRALMGLLLTGLRINELLRLDWSDVNEAERRLEIRQSKTTAFTKFIGPELAAMFAQWRGDMKRGRVFEVDDLRAALDQVVALGGKQITAHDLRRTFLTVGNNVGAPLITLKQLANHSTKADVTAGYVQADADNLRHWASVIEAAILTAAKGGAPNVVPLKRRARS